MSGSIRLTGVNGLPLGGSGLRYPGVYAALDFANNVYELGGVSRRALTALPGFTFTRASTATFFGSNGLLQTAASGVARFAYDPVTLASLGILVEEARTNIALHNRDLTNAAWVKTTVTAAKDQTGIDGVANSASSITATAPAATVVQTVVLASSTRQQSAWVKRITGSGVVNMTTDGVTWTAITVTAGWTLVTIPAQATVVNPVFGFQIMTSGNAIAVDFVQNEGGTGASSPIATTTASVTRAADVPAEAGLAAGPTTTVVIELIRNAPSFAGYPWPYALSDGTSSNYQSLYCSAGDMLSQVVAGGAAQGDVTIGSGQVAGTAYRIATRHQAGSRRSAVNGVLSPLDADDIATSLLTKLNIGAAFNGVSALNGTISRIRIFKRALSDAELQAITT